MINDNFFFLLNEAFLALEIFGEAHRLNLSAFEAYHMMMVISLAPFVPALFLSQINLFNQILPAEKFQLAVHRGLIGAQTANAQPLKKLCYGERAMV